VIALVFFLLASTVIINTTMMVIFERMREIGTVAAMGMTPQEIVRLFFLEAFYIGAIAAFVGVVLGIAVTIPLSKTGIDLTQSMGGVDLEINPVIYPRLNIRSTVFVFFYSTAIASLASFIPSRRAAKIEPVEALRAV
jgi:putative ABC transport system permease protein